MCFLSCRVRSCTSAQLVPLFSANSWRSSVTFIRCLKALFYSIRCSRFVVYLVLVCFEQNEARNKEMLTVGCAVGIGCCFAAPIGGEKTCVCVCVCCWNDVENIYGRTLKHNQNLQVIYVTFCKSFCVCFRCIIRFGGHIYVFRCTKLLAWISVRYIWCLNLQTSASVEQRGRCVCMYIDKAINHNRLCVTAFLTPARALTSLCLSEMHSRW